MSTSLRWPLVIVISCLLMGVLLSTAVPSPARVAVTTWFLLVCTGMAYAPLLSLPSLAAEIGLGLLLSVALDTLVATTIVVAGGMSAATAFLVLACICLAGCALQTWAWTRARSAARAAAS